jgi:hypothetical protein
LQLVHWRELSYLSLTNPLIDTCFLFIIIFQVSHGLALNILAFIPTVIIGVFGGLLGALFTFINLKVTMVTDFFSYTVAANAVLHLKRCLTYFIRVGNLHHRHVTACCNVEMASRCFCASHHNV